MCILDEKFSRFCLDTHLIIRASLAPQYLLFLLKSPVFAQGPPLNTIFAKGTPLQTIFAEGTPLHTIFAQGQIHRSTNPNDHKPVTQLYAGARENRPIGR